MIDKETLERLKANSRFSEELEQEFERRTRFHMEKLGGNNDDLLGLAQMLALEDIRNGDTKNIAPRKPKTQRETTILDKLLQKDPKEALRFTDCLKDGGTQ